MKMVKPAKPVTKDRVHFIVHPQMSKFDVRNYLEKIYKVPVLDVRTENREGEDIIHPTRKHVVGKKPDYKLAYVQLGEGHTFEFLDIFEGKTLEADKQVEEYMKMSKSQEKIKQKDWEKLTIPPWFRWNSMFNGAWSVCRFIISLVLSLDLCSCYHLVFITGCRYIAVAHPLKYNMHVTDRRVLVSISLIWVLSQLFSILYSTYEPVDYINMCRFELIFPVSHVTILMFIQLFLPMVIMMILNLKMAQIARKQARVMATQEISVIRSRSSSSASNRENKSTFVVTLLLSCYAMAWMPTVIFFYYSVTCGGCCVSDYIRATCRLLLYMNSAANVFVYAGRMGEFRYFVKKDIKQLWTWIKCQKR